MPPAPIERTVRVAITQDLVDEAYGYAHALHARYPYEDPGDIEHDALYGLYLAACTWAGEVDFPLYARFKVYATCRQAIWARMRKRTYAGNPLSLDAPDRDGNRIDLPTSTLEEQILGHEEAHEAISALLQEHPILQDIVLRAAADAVLAAQAGYSDVVSINRLRRRWLQHYRRCLLLDRPYTPLNWRPRPATALQHRCPPPCSGLLVRQNKWDAHAHAWVSCRVCATCGATDPLPDIAGDGTPVVDYAP